MTRLFAELTFRCGTSAASHRRSQPHDAGPQVRMSCPLPDRRWDLSNTRRFAGFQTVRKTNVRPTLILSREEITTREWAIVTLRRVHFHLPVRYFGPIHGISGISWSRSPMTWKCHPYRRLRLLFSVLPRR